MTKETSEMLSGITTAGALACGGLGMAWRVWGQERFLSPDGFTRAMMQPISPWEVGWWGGAGVFLLLVLLLDAKR